MNKYRFFFILGVVLIASCQKEITIQDNVSAESDTSLNTKSNTSLYYHTTTGLVLEEINDNRKVELQASRFSDDKIDAFALKIYPRSISEQQAIETMEGVIVSYIPFGYTPANAELLPKEYWESAYSILENENDCYEDREEKCYTPDSLQRGNETKRIHLPTMYVEWPKNIPFPVGLEYEVLYGLRKVAPPDPPVIQYGYELVFQTYDSSIEEDVRLENLKIRVDMGGGVYDYKYTDNKGHISVEKDIQGATYMPRQFVLTSVLSSDKWTISRTDTTSTPIHLNLGQISQWETGFLTDTVYVTVTPVAKELLIHRAVNYYHNKTHSFSSSILPAESQTLFCALSESNTNYNGHCYFPTTTTGARIVIYNNSISMSHMIGAVFHEIGHCKKAYAGYDGYNTESQMFIHESYASFIGWVLCREYYESIGRVFTSENDYMLFNPCHYQIWTYMSGSDYRFYSPLFIDFCDTFNQHSFSTSYVNDTIAGVGPGTIEPIAKTSSSLSLFITNVGSLTGTAFSQEALNNMMSYYTPYFL